MTGQRTDHERILIAGASVRSAAQSTVRAGFQPVCADIFGDSDLREIADVHVIDEYPRGFVDWANQIHRTEGRLPLLYTGGLENYPQTIDSLARLHNLQGNAGDSLRCVRDPGQLSDCFFKANIQYPAVRMGANAELLANPDESWMKKPIHGSAGFGIARWQGEKLLPNHYLQRQISGPSISVLYVASGGAAQLIGATLQLVGFQSLSGGRFGWCGSFGPIALSDQVETQAKSIGNALVSQFQLKGIIGVDCVINGQSLLPIEVNPRYTGSVEVLEKSTGWHAIPHHLLACAAKDSAENRVTNSVFAPTDQNAKICCCGKAILFAPRSITVQNLRDFEEIVADIPLNGTVIQAGNPVCSIMGDGIGPLECITHWSENVQRVYGQLFGDEVDFEREIRQLWQELCSTGLID